MKIRVHKTAVVASAIAASLLGFGQLLAQGSSARDTVNFTETYQDPDSFTAKQLARAEGISVAEAARRLDLMNQASILHKILEDRYPDHFAGTSAVSRPPLFRVNVYFAGAKPAVMREQIRSLGVKPQLLAVLRVGEAPRSGRATRAQARGILRQMQVRGIEGVVASFGPTGGLKLLVKDPAEAAAAVRMGVVNVPADTKIEQFDGIILTATEVVGGYGYTGPTQDCTRGFNVKLTNANTYGISTAGHCDNSGTDDQYNKNLGFQAEWTSNNVDSQWSTYLGGSNYVVTPKFWNGSTALAVTGGQSDYSGLYVCKYGIATNTTCGYVDPYQYSDSYGDFPRVNHNTTYPTQSAHGDSGGPVFTGSLAVGMVHGADLSGNMYYTPLRAWLAANLPISVTCQCP